MTRPYSGNPARARAIIQLISVITGRTIAADILVKPRKAPR